MDRTHLEARIAKTKVLITAHEDAIEAILAGGAMQAYTLDTGQSRQSVTRADLSNLEKTLDSLYNRLDVFCARLNLSGVVVARPGF